jgi:hypothetical protein
MLIHRKGTSSELSQLTQHTINTPGKELQCPGWTAAGKEREKEA